MESLVGYINIFGRNSGFVFPVFEQDGVRVISDGDSFAEVDPELLNEPFYFNFAAERLTEEQVKIKHSECNMFVYNEGGDKLVFKDNDLDALKNLYHYSNLLTSGEKRELKHYIDEFEIIRIADQFLIEINAYKLNKNSKWTFTEEDKKKCEEFSVQYSFSEDIGIADFYQDNKSLIKNMMADGRFSDQVTIFLTLLRFESITSKKVFQIHNTLYNPKKVNSSIQKAFFLLALKNNTDNVIYNYIRLDLAKSDGELTNSLLSFFYDLKIQKDIDVNIYSNKLFSYINEWVKIGSKSDYQEEESNRNLIENLNAIKKIIEEFEPTQMLFSDEYLKLNEIIKELKPKENIDALFDRYHDESQEMNLAN